MPEVGFQQTPLAELIARAESDINVDLVGADAALRRSVLNVLARVVSGQTHGLTGFLNYIAKQAIVDTSDTDSLEHWGRVWEIKRKPAAKATGLVTFSGSNGSDIPFGTECIISNELSYITTQSVEITSGQASVPVLAKTAGESGNASSSVEVSLLSPIAGVNSAGVVGAAGITGGAATEDDPSLLARILERIQTPPHGGSLSDYRNWAKEVPGVTRAWPVGGEMGEGTVTVRFMMDNTYSDGLPTPADVLTVQNYIDDEDRRPLTAHVFVVAPLPVSVDITIQDLQPNTADVRVAVQAELVDLFKRTAEPGKPLPVSKLWEAVAVASDEDSHIITTPAANIIPSTAGEMPTLGTVTFSTGGV